MEPPRHLSPTGDPSSPDHPCQPTLVELWARPTGTDDSGRTRHPSDAWAHQQLRIRELQRQRLLTLDGAVQLQRREAARRRLRRRVDRMDAVARADWTTQRRALRVLPGGR